MTLGAARGTCLWTRILMCCIRRGVVVRRIRLRSWRRCCWLKCYAVSDRGAERRSRVDLSWKAALGLPVEHRGILMFVCLSFVLGW